MQASGCHTSLHRHGDATWATGTRAGVRTRASCPAGSVASYQTRPGRISTGGTRHALRWLYMYTHVPHTQAAVITRVTHTRDTVTNQGHAMPRSERVNNGLCALVLQLFCRFETIFSEKKAVFLKANRCVLSRRPQDQWLPDLPKGLCTTHGN